MGSSAPASVLLLVLFVLVAPASAQLDPAGSYRATAIALQTDLREWPAACGPLPTLPQAAAGPVEVRRTGNQLAFSGAMRGRSNDCFWPDRDVQNVSTSSEPSRYTTVCRSSEGNPLRTAVRVILEVRSEGIAFRASGTMEREVAGRRCVASVVATRALDRLVGPASAPAMDASPAPAPVARVPAAPTALADAPTCVPGPPASIRLRGPGRPLGPGERFCPVAEVLDANGCVIPGARVTLALTAPRGRVASLTGDCFASSSSAAEAEGRYRLEARHGALGTGVEIVVEAADLSDITAVATRDRPRRTASTARAGSASGIEARAVPRNRKLRAVLFAGIAAVFLLGTLGVLILRRSRRRAQGDAGPERP